MHDVPCFHTDLHCFGGYAFCIVTVLRRLVRFLVPVLYRREVPCIVISSADVAKQLFKTHDILFSNRPGGCFFEQLTEYRNITASRYGPHWRHLRKTCVHELFTQKRLEAYQATRLEEISISIKELFEESDKKGPVDLHAWLHRLLSNNLTRVIMNNRYTSPTLCSVYRLWVISLGR